MDFTSLRAHAMRSTDEEEQVTVNTRALIDKVLARYSGEWTTLRELLQNAADAQATAVKIRFETLPSVELPTPQTTNPGELLKHVIKHHKLHRLTVANDGQAFGPNDWARLKRIAEGNPDETKIGAFGVGFYSVFQDCEEPFVSSGQEAMAFYWKTNSLFTRKIQIPPGSGKSSDFDTTFVLDYRNTTSEVPDFLKICKFLATSLTFVALQKIELWLDDWRMLSLKKKTSPGVDVPISSDAITKTPENLMKVQKLVQETVQLDASYLEMVGWKPAALAISAGDHQDGSAEVSSLRSFFARLATNNSSAPHNKARVPKDDKVTQTVVPADLMEVSLTSVFLRVTTATVKTSVPAAFAVELERATKKPPPKTTRLAILTTTYDQILNSNLMISNKEKRTNLNIFESVLPAQEDQKRGKIGRVFIGFPTVQTTGAGMHISAPSLIPTVEREAIDFNANWVKTWNIEMLRVAGIVSRLTFTSEMQLLSQSIQRSTEDAGRKGKITKEDITYFMPHALHILNTFTFSDSTPSGEVGRTVSQMFWRTYRKSVFEMYSTRGVLPTSVVRLTTDDFSGFVEGIPVVPAELASTRFVKLLTDIGLISEITIADVKKELGAKALTRSQLTYFLLWIGKKAITNSIDAATIQSLLDSTIATIGETDDRGDIITLSTIKYYRTPSKIPPELPGPPNALPFEITKACSSNELQALGWEPLEVVPWIRFLTESTKGRNGLSSEHDMTWSPKFSAQVLAIVSKQWDSLSQNSKGTIVSLLQPLAVIPTKYGMKRPAEAYFANVKLFDDLPIISGCPGVKEKLLAAMGVRKTVELEVIFQRLLNPSTPGSNDEKAVRWSHVELITYLASVKDDIPVEDLKKLREAPICTAEAGPQGLESSVATTRLFKISELFEPNSNLRQLNLPILYWSSKTSWRANSVEGRFMYSLGLRGCPSVPELVEMMTSTESSIRDKAMTYFITTHQQNHYSGFDISTVKKQFIPIDDDGKRLVAPNECFVDEKARLLGFRRIRRDLVAHAKIFGVAEHPSMNECVSRLVAAPPRSRRSAVEIFEYFALRLGDIRQDIATRLGESAIVPIMDKAVRSAEKTELRIRMVAPRQCFTGRSSTFEDIFDFVDFGTDANRFLMHCGSNHEPTRVQLATMLVKEPARILGSVSSYEKYLSLLKTLAVSQADLKKDSSLCVRMKSSPFLLAVRRVSKKPKNPYTTGDDADEYEDDEEADVIEYTLQPAKNIVIVDDYSTFNIFKHDLLSAPEDESLESFYQSLGSSTISSLITNDIRIGGVLQAKEEASAKIRKHILERAKVFLHESQPSDVNHNARWLESNIAVGMVSSISIRQSLRGHPSSHTVKTTASMGHERGTGWLLNLTRDFDWYHVSRALVVILLKRPSNQATTTFEFILKADLYDLKRRGYNVNRILRSHAVNARIAETERQTQLLEEQQRSKSPEAEQAQHNQQELVPVTAKSEKRKFGQVAMPGAFNNDPPEPSHAPNPPKSPMGILANFTKRLGLSNGEVQEQLRHFLDGDTSTNDGNGARSGGGAGVVQKQPRVQRNAEGAEKVTSPEVLQQNLRNAVQMARSHDSPQLSSQPQSSEIKEQSSYCDSSSGHNIIQVGSTSNGLKIFLSKEAATPPRSFLSQNADALDMFGQVLQETAHIYEFTIKSINVFYDDTGSTIAFNSNGSLFCNLRFFKQLHQSNFATPQGKVLSISWWWVVVAHELAHNLVSSHSAEHSYYTESFISHFFPKMMSRAIHYMAATQPQRSLLD